MTCSGNFTTNLGFGRGKTRPIQRLRENSRGSGCQRSSSTTSTSPLRPIRADETREVRGRLVATGQHPNLPPRSDGRRAVTFEVKLAHQFDLRAIHEANALRIHRDASAAFVLVVVTKAGLSKKPRKLLLWRPQARERHRCWPDFARSLSNRP